MMRDVNLIFVYDNEKVAQKDWEALYSEADAIKDHVAIGYTSGYNNIPPLNEKLLLGMNYIFRDLLTELDELIDNYSRGADSSKQIEDLNKDIKLWYSQILYHMDSSLALNPPAVSLNELIDLLQKYRAHREFYSIFLSKLYNEPFKLYKIFYNSHPLALIVPTRKYAAWIANVYLQNGMYASVSTTPISLPCDSAGNINWTNFYANLQKNNTTIEKIAKQYSNAKDILFISPTDTDARVITSLKNQFPNYAAIPNKDFAVIHIK